MFQLARVEVIRGIRKFLCINKYGFMRDSSIMIALSLAIFVHSTCVTKHGFDIVPHNNSGARYLSCFGKVDLV